MPGTRLFAQGYTNGANVYANTDLQITTGASTGFFAGGVNSPRTWNGTIYYDAAAVPEPSTMLLAAAGLLGFLFKARSRK